MTFICGLGSLPHPQRNVAQDVTVQSKLTYRIVWLHPMMATSRDRFEEGIRLAVAEYQNNYNIDFTERLQAGSVADLYIFSAITHHPGGAITVFPEWHRQWNYQWPGIYFAAQDSRAWSLQNIKTICQHELLHWFRFGGGWYHSEDKNCISNINATAINFCPTEDTWLTQTFGRRTPPAPPLPTFTITEAAVKRPGTLQFIVSLSHAYHEQVRVDCQTHDHTAAAELGDFRHNHKTLIFKPGLTQRAFEVRVWANSRDIGKNVQLRVTLSNPVNATVSRGLGREFARGFILP